MYFINFFSLFKKKDKEQKLILKKLDHTEELFMKEKSLYELTLHKYWHRDKIVNYQYIIEREESCQYSDEKDRERAFRNLLRDGVICIATFKEEMDFANGKYKLKKNNSTLSSKETYRQYLPSDDTQFWYRGRIRRFKTIKQKEGWIYYPNKYYEEEYNALLKSGELRFATPQDITNKIKEQNKKTAHKPNRVRKKTSNSLPSSHLEIKMSATSPSYLGTDIGGEIGNVIGKAIGKPIEYVGEVFESKFVQDVGKGVISASKASGEIVGGLAGGTVKSIKSIAQSDGDGLNQGLEEMETVTKKLGKSIGNSIVSTVSSGADILNGLETGDNAQIKKGISNIAKKVAVGTIVGGTVLLIDDQIDTVENSTDQSLSDSEHFVKPHYVESYVKADGSVIEGYWRDGDGNTDINLSAHQGGGYIRSNS